MSPNSTSNTMLMSVALVIGSEAERREGRTQPLQLSATQLSVAPNNSTHQSATQRSVTQKKIINTEEWCEEAPS